jgi:hypothetical protein
MWKILSRYQEGCTTDLKEIKHSLPQGSVLGMLLFLLHINDIPIMIIVVKLAMLANNTKATNKNILNKK